MTADELLESILEGYYDADLPANPLLRLASLRDIVINIWTAVPTADRLALAEELDGSKNVAGLAAANPHLSAHEQRELDEQAVDGLVDWARQEIPELATGDSNAL